MAREQGECCRVMGEHACLSMLMGGGVTATLL